MAFAFKRKHQLKPNGRWTACWTDELGHRHYKAVSREKATTLEVALREESTARLVREGLISAADKRFQDASRRHVNEHIEDYGVYLLSKGGTEKHVHHTTGVLQRLFVDAGFSRLPDIRPERLQNALGRVRGAKSARTANFALMATKGLLRFLVADGRIGECGWMGMVKPFNERVDRKRKRRVLTKDEIAVLIQTVESSPCVEVVRGRRSDPGPAQAISGHERALIYMLALHTGLRANELRSIRVADFDWENRRVTVRAAYSKHRREDILPLPGWLATQLHHWCVRPSKTPDSIAFLVPERCGRMLAHDLDRAGIPLETAEGVLDFHSLRHTFISGLIERGVDPKTAQELSRHSTITLTVDRYSHTTEDRKRAAIEIESPLPESPHPSSSRCG